MIIDLENTNTNLVTPIVTPIVTPLITEIPVLNTLIEPIKTPTVTDSNGMDLISKNWSQQYGMRKLSEEEINLLKVMETNQEGIHPTSITFISVPNSAWERADGSRDVEIIRLDLSSINSKIILKNLTIEEEHLKEPLLPAEYYVLQWDLGIWGLDYLMGRLKKNY